MVGLGEGREEVSELLADLRASGCGMVTAGQYLQPAANNVRVTRYWEPAEFEKLEEEARSLGFSAVAAGPLVRSSYRAGELL
jgi:lipoic acid synthetase